MRPVRGADPAPPRAGSPCTWLLGRPALALQVNRRTITAATAMRVARLYEDVNEGRLRRPA